MLTLDWNIIWTFVNILALFFLLKKFLFGPVTKMMEKRTRLVEEQLADAARKQKAAAEEQAAYAGMLQKANTEADRILREARSQAELKYREAMERAEQDAQKRMAQAEKLIAQEREQMLQSAKGEVAALALLAAGRLVEKRADAQTEQKLLDEFIAEAGALR